jgi:hypothetical protein
MKGPKYGGPLILYHGNTKHRLATINQWENLESD